MPNINQNNEIENINKEISLLQDRLKINEKSLNQFQNALTRIGNITKAKKKSFSNQKDTKNIERYIKK